MVRWSLVWIPRFNRGLKTFTVHETQNMFNIALLQRVPNNKVPGFGALVIMLQVLGKYMTIGYLDHYGTPYGGQEYPHPKCCSYIPSTILRTSFKENPSPTLADSSIRTQKKLLCIRLNHFLIENTFPTLDLMLGLG